MGYDDDDNLFDEEFDFVDEDDAEESAEADAGDEGDEPPPSKSRRRNAGKAKAPGERSKNRSKPAGPAGGRRGNRADRAPSEQPTPEPESDSTPLDEEPAPVEAIHEESAPEPAGPPADHVVHIYEYGRLKRTIPRKFTDEEAVAFAEEYTRTGKAYGRYAVATPDDEEPSPTFAGLAHH